MAIVNQRLTTTQLDILEVPPGKSYAITNIMVCNTDSNSDDAAGSFDMHLVPNSTALASTTNMVIKALELPKGETFTFDSEKIVLEEGDKLSFIARDDNTNNPTNLSATVSYLEV